MADMAQARKRLVFDELLRVQLALVLRKRELERRSVGIAHRSDGQLVRQFVDRLPYRLTSAQDRVIDEITTDLVTPAPMHRLLQGDVGAGKTVVAVCALLTAVDGGHQGALMAPTAVLAEQHHLGIKDLLDGFTVPDESGSLFADRELRVELLTNRTTAAERRRLAERLADGTVDILIGTHALLEDAVAFRSLGVVVIDEQHRFGVEQRAALRGKGAGEAVPDVLVMTATPIPRTAAMTVYGDLDVSILDELPPGRTPIETEWVRTDGPDGTPTLDAETGHAAVWDVVRSEVAAGRQVYVVCPLVEESEKLEVRSAEETFEELQGGELHGLRLGLLHGRVRADDKEAVMAQFRAGDIDVLVATTVIEVGVDVPNATVMVILDADRFGIAQLHQLRGRVGRGAVHSRCFLVGSGATPEAEARLGAMVRTTDGFELAEIDLDLRGEGTLMGERQKGRNDLRLASLRRDREWVAKARDAAFHIVDGDPDMARHAGLLDEVQLLLGDDDTDNLLKS
jgi:ATP-dependent DNA helicase RecG